MNTKELITLFEEIRDVPYSIPLDVAEEDNCCSGKHQRFKDILEQ